MSFVGFVHVLYPLHRVSNSMGRYVEIFLQACTCTITSTEHLHSPSNEIPLLTILRIGSKSDFKICKYYIAVSHKMCKRMFHQTKQFLHTWVSENSDDLNYFTPLRPSGVQTWSSWYEYFLKIIVKTSLSIQCSTYMRCSKASKKLGDFIFKMFCKEMTYKKYPAFLLEY